MARNSTMVDPRGLPRHTPSAHSAWTEGGEDILTQAQEAAILRISSAANQARIEKGLAPFHKVRLELQARPGDQGERRYIYRKCPVLNSTQDGKRLLVIAPDGSEQWVAR
jgi:hypothetical protein